MSFNATADGEACPVCGSEVQQGQFNSRGISSNALASLSKHVKSGILDDVLKIAEIAMRNLTQDRLLLEVQQKEYLDTTQDSIIEMLNSIKQHQELPLREIVSTDESLRKGVLEVHLRNQAATTEQHKIAVIEKMENIRRAEEDRIEEYSELSKTLHEMRDKLFGTSIGTAGEVVTILDLKKVCPTDEFSEVRAAKHGTDIVADVIEHGRRCGRLSISVKYQQKWDAEFLVQLTRNLEQDNSKWGLLVTRVFPKEALSNQMWTSRDGNGNLILMVKPEYCPLAYYAIRQIVMHWSSIERALSSQRAIEDEQERIKQAVLTWLNGEKFKATVRNISNAMELNRKVVEGILSTQTYIGEKLRKLRDHGDEIHQSLEQVMYGLNDFKQMLKSPGELIEIQVPVKLLSDRQTKESEVHDK